MALKKTGSCLFRDEEGKLFEARSYANSETGVVHTENVEFIEGSDIEPICAALDPVARVQEAPVVKKSRVMSLLTMKIW